MAMLVVKSWICALSLIPCSLFHFFPNFTQASTLCVANGLAGQDDLSTYILAICVQVNIFLPLGMQLV